MKQDIRLPCAKVQIIVQEIDKRKFLRDDVSHELPFLRVLVQVGAYG